MIFVKKHNFRGAKYIETGKILPRLIISIGKVKRVLLEIHHKIKSKYLKSYLDEFSLS